MPQGFMKCVNDGGKVITKRLGMGKYMKMCKDKAGKWHQGEEHMYKKILKGKKNG